MMEASEHSAEYAVRVVAALLVALVAAVIFAVIMHFLLQPFSNVDSAGVAYISGALQFVGRGFAFVLAGSVVLPRSWRLAGALVLVILGVGLQMHLRSYTSDADPPLWPVFAVAAGGLVAVAVHFPRRYRHGH